MKITSQAASFQPPQIKPKKNDNENASSNSQNKQPVDQYIPSKEEKVITYKKPTTKVDTATIDRLKMESERAHEQLRNLVRQMLERQGVTLKDVKSGKVEFKVDNQARLEAQAAIDEGGPLSAENVSNRIVDFAKAISGGDKSKFELLKNAIGEGFNAAKKALGGSLPEVSQKTYDLVMEKLDNWRNED